MPMSRIASRAPISDDSTHTRYAPAAALPPAHTRTRTPCAGYYDDCAIRNVTAASLGGSDTDVNPAVINALPVNGTSNTLQARR